MRLVIYVLILVNGIGLAWLYQHRFDMPAASIYETRMPNSIEPLIVLSERTKIEPSVVPAENRSLPETSPLVPSAPTSADAATSNNTPVEDAQAHSIQVDPTTSRLQTATTNVPVDPDSVRICEAIGPFTERRKVDAFILGITAMGVTTSLRTVQIEQPSGYWVYLPPMSQAEAQHVVSDFNSKGVQDYFLGRQNFISLGVFTDKRSAEARVQSIKTLGYDPRLEPRFLSREVYWVDLEHAPPESLGQIQWDSLLQGQEGVRRQPLTCE